MVLNFPSMYIEVEYDVKDRKWVVVEHDGWESYETGIFDKKTDAVEQARKTAKEYNNGLVVRGKKNQITEKSRYDK